MKNMIDGGNARIISTSWNQTIVCIYINYHTFGSGRSSPFLRLCSNKWITISVSFTLLSNFQTRVTVSEVPSKTVIARFTAKYAVCHQQKEDCRLHSDSDRAMGKRGGTRTHLQMPQSSQWNCSLSTYTNSPRHLIYLQAESADQVNKTVYSSNSCSLHLTSSSKNLHVVQKYSPMQTPQLQHTCAICNGRKTEVIIIREIIK
jgi:hypothetical protein